MGGVRLRPQNQGHKNALARRGDPAPAASAAPRRLPVGDGAQAVRRTGHGLRLQIAVGGVDLRKALHQSPPRLRQIGQHVPGRERIRPRAQTVAPVRDGVNVIARGAQCTHCLTDRRARHAQLFAHLLAGYIALRLREQEQNIIPQHPITPLVVRFLCL